MKPPEKNDPLEQAFFDYLAGDSAAEITVHNSKGEDEQWPVAYFFRDFEGMPALEQLALKECSGHVLDIGAGAGSHALWLQSQGMNVTALDIRPGLVDIMRRRGVEHVIREDIYHFKDGRFDTLLMLMNGVGLTTDFKGLERFLAHALTLLNPGGQLLLDSSDLLYLYREDDGSILLDLSDDYYGEVEYCFEYAGVKGKRFWWLFIDLHSLAHYAGQAGFRVECLYEDDHYNYLARLY